jgi:hypothetical protein
VVGSGHFDSENVMSNSYFAILLSAVLLAPHANKYLCATFAAVLFTASFLWK